MSAIAQKATDDLEIASQAGSGGTTPGEWKVVAFDNLFEFRNGVNADKKAYGSGIPFVNVLEVITNSHLRITDIPGLVTLSAKAIDAYRLRRGDVLFNRTSETQDEVGLTSVYLDDNTAVFGGFVIRGRPHGDQLDPVYAGYSLRSRLIRNQIIALGQGAIHANIGQIDLKKVTVPIPPLAEQRAIAAALSDVDALIGMLDTLIAKKRMLKLATMQQLLTGQSRLPGFDDTREFHETQVGKVPSDWGVKVFADLCLKIQDGTHFSPKVGGNDYLYVTSRNIGYGFIDLADVDRIDAAQHRAIYSRCDVQKGDLLLTKDGANTGNAAINTISDEFSLLSSVAFLRFKSACDPRFFLQYVLSRTGQQRLKDLMSGNAITRLTLQKIRSFSVPVPGFPEQVAIADILCDMDSEIEALERRRDKTKAIKQGMMQALLTGRVRLVKPEAVGA